MDLEVELTSGGCRRGALHGTTPWPARSRGRQGYTVLAVGDVQPALQTGLRGPGVPGHLSHRRPALAGHRDDVPTELRRERLGHDAVLHVRPQPQRQGTGRTRGSHGIVGITAQQYATGSTTPWDGIPAPRWEGPACTRRCTPVLVDPPRARLLRARWTAIAGLAACPTPFGWSLPPWRRWSCGGKRPREPRRAADPSVCKHPWLAPAGANRCDQSRAAALTGRL